MTFVIVLFFFFLMMRQPPKSTRTDTLFPYATLFRSGDRENILVTATGQVDDDAFADTESRRKLLCVSDGVRRPAQADRKSTRLNSSHSCASRMPSSA